MSEIFHPVFDWWPKDNLDLRLWKFLSTKNHPSIRLEGSTKLNPTDIKLQSNLWHLTTLNREAIYGVKLCDGWFFRNNRKLQC